MKNSILSLLATIIFLQTSFATINPETKPVKEDSLKISLEEAEKNRKDLLETSLALFSQENWTEARVSLTNYLEIHPTPMRDFHLAQYHFASSCLNTGDYTTAITVFEELINDANIDAKLKKDATYDLATSFLAVDLNSSIKLYETIAMDKTHPNQKDARGMLLGLK